MNGIVEVTVGVVAVLGISIIRGIAADEIRGQLDRVPWAVLRIARKRVPKELRVKLYDEEWKPELDYILQSAEARPISRLVLGTRYALGLLRAARTISRMRAGSAAADIELRRLISLSAAVNAIGNLTTVGAVYISTAVIGFTTSVALITALGLVRVGIWLALQICLATVFGLVISGMLATIAGPGWRRVFRRLIVPPPIAVAPMAHAHGRFVRTLAVSSRAISSNSRGWVPVAISFITCFSGVILGIFAGLSIGRIIGILAISILAVNLLAGAVFVFAGSMQRRHKRRYARLRESADLKR